MRSLKGLNAIGKRNGIKAKIWPLEETLTKNTTEQKEARRRGVYVAAATRNTLLETTQLISYLFPLERFMFKYQNTSILGDEIGRG